MSEGKGPQPQITSSVGDATQSKLYSLDTLVNHDIHHAMWLLLLVLLIPLVIELLVALWYWSIALAECEHASAIHAHPIRTKNISVLIRTQ